jgi:hypothetical protein
MVLIELPSIAVARSRRVLRGPSARKHESVAEIPTASVIHAATLSLAQASLLFGFCAQERGIFTRRRLMRFGYLEHDDATSEDSIVIVHLRIRYRPTCRANMSCG